MNNRYLDLLAWLWILPLIVAAIAWLIGTFASGDLQLFGAGLAGLAFPFGSLMLLGWLVAGAIVTQLERAAAPRN